MTWLYLLLIAHFLNAIVFMVAKYFVSGPIPNVRAYAFYESLGSASYLVAIPFVGIALLPIGDLAICIFAGFVFSIALVFLYNAIQRHDVSGVAPAVGAMTAIFTLIIGFLFLQSAFSRADFWAFAFLVIGTFLASNMKVDSHDARTRIVKELSSATAASFLLALFYVLIKLEYNKFGFISPFLWTRVGMLVGAGFIFIFMNKNNSIVDSFRNSHSSLRFGFIGIKMVAGVAFLLIAYSAYLGNVALVNAMQGLQYMFLILISGVLLWVSPKLVMEHYTKHQWIHKIFAIILIIAGLVLLGGGRH